MVLVELTKDAAGSLGRHQLRTSLTMLGMIFGVAAVLAMLSIAAGAEEEALDMIARMGLRNIVVRAKSFEESEMQVIRQDSPGLSRKDIDALRKALPAGTVLVGKKILKTYQVGSEFAASDSRVIGVNAIYPQLASLSVVEGSFFLPSDELKANQVCVLGTTSRSRLFGLSDPLGQGVKINDVWFAVIGVLADQFIEKQEFEGIKIENPNNEIFIPLGTLLTKFERDPVANELDDIIIRVPESEGIAEQAAFVSAMVGSMHRQIDDFTLVVPERLLTQSRQTRRIFNIVMGAIASISLLVGGIGIMNIMLATVLERTGEIGLRRALGARRRDISRQFLLEALVISVSGATIGIGLGYGIASLVSTYSGWPTIVTPLSVLLGVGVSMTVGLVFGIYPARQASHVSPIEALRYE